MSRIEHTTESKKTQEKWLPTTVRSSLQRFYTLPHNVLMIFVLMHLDNKALAITSRVSKSFSEVIKEFKRTAGQKNFEQFLISKLGKLAQKQNIELKDMSMPEALSTVEHVIEIKSSALDLRVQSGQSNIYTKAIQLLAAGGGNRDFSATRALSPCIVNTLRILFILLFSVSVLDLHRHAHSDQNEARICVEVINGLLAAVTGSTLLVDFVQSLRNCSQQREVNEEKSQVSSLQTTYFSIYSSGNNSSLNDESKTSEAISSYYVQLGNGND